MSIASQIEALSQDKEDIAVAIEEKGVTVPSGSGFRNFAGLISNIFNGKKALYVEEVFDTDHCRQYLSYELDFEPQAIMVVCNESYNTLKQIIDLDNTATATNKCFLSKYCRFEQGFADDMELNIVLSFWQTSASDAYTTRTSYPWSKTKVGDKWQFTLGRTDTSSYAHRIIQSGNENLPLQVLFIGE